MSCSGGNCNCGNGGKGCSMYPDLSFSETTATETIIAGVAPAKISHERLGMSSFAENGCKCGSSCSCDPCSCK